MPDDFRCSAASAFDAEPLAGTAPTDTAFLCVEYAGAWGRDAPKLLDEHASVPAGVRPQLIRRYRSAGRPGHAVFVAWLEDDRFRVETTTVDHLDDLAALDLAAPAEGRSPGLTPYDEPLWLVCTNGRRDRCCAELGRPVVAALAELRPEETWETTHLGGHRFAATLLALPSGVALGRLDADSAVDACHDLLAGRGTGLGHWRGRAGRPAVAQVAELHLLGAGVQPGRLLDATVDGGLSRVHFEGGTVTVETLPGEPRRQSCADPKTKAVPVHRVVTYP